MVMRLYLLAPSTVFAARINQASFNWPLAEVTYDTVTTGSFGAIQPGMTVLFGSTAGADNLGRQRIRKAADSTKIYFGRSSQGERDGEALLVDDGYITVLNDYRPWAKIPYIDDDGVIYKDHDLTVGTNTTTPPPKSNPGVPAAGTINSGTGKLRVQLPGASNASYGQAGATISTYAWVLPGGVSLVGGYLASDAVIQVDCDPGFYWIELTVTDSNGKTHTARTAVYARDPASDTTVSAFTIENHTRRKEGQQLSVRILEDIPTGTYPDGTFVILFEGEPASVTDRSNVKFWGFHHTDPAAITSQRTGILRDVTLECLDLAGKLDTLPGFPVSVEGKASPTTWAEMVSPNMDLYIDYLLRWHSTALELPGQFTTSGTGSDYPFVILGSDGQSLFDQVNRRAQSLVPNHYFTCDSLGRLAIKVDPMLQATGSRTATVQAALTEADWTDIRYTHQRPPRVHWLRSEAILASATEVAALFSIGPGLTPGQGETEIPHGEQLARSQDDLNISEGHRYARLNAPEGYFAVTLAGNDDRDIEPAAMTWVTLTMSAATAAQRGLAFTAGRGLVHEVSTRYQHERTGLVKVHVLTWERETSGIAALTYEPPDADLPPGYEPDPPPPTEPPVVGDGLKTAYVMVQDLLKRTRLLGAVSPAWTTLKTASSETFYDFILDPYNPATKGYLISSAGVYKSTNLDLESPTFSLILSKASIETAASLTSGSFQKAHKIVASPNYDGYVGFAFMAQQVVGTAQYWFARSLDGGSSWSYSLIASHSAFNGYLGGLDIVPRPISSDLRLYIAIYNDNPTSKFRLFRSNDKGATWTQRNEQTGGPEPAGGTCVHCPFNDNANGDIVYWSYDPDNIESAFVSTDGGTTPTGLGLGNAANDEAGTMVRRTGIESFTPNRQLMYAWRGNANKLLVSNNAGSTWTEAGDTPGGIPRACGGFPANENLYYLVTHTGIFASLNKGASWSSKTGDWSSFSADAYNAVIVPLWTTE